MIEIGDGTTVGEAFSRAAAAYASRDFLVVPVNPQRSYHPAGYTLTYAAAAMAMTRTIAQNPKTTSTSPSR